MDSFKLHATTEFCIKMLESHIRPCVLWSGGKDSMVLLHILKQLTETIPVVCWREPWLPVKQRFVNQIIDLWNLDVWDWHPTHVTLVKGMGRIDVLNHYQFGMQGATVTLARGVEKNPAQGERLMCGRDTLLSRPCAPFVPPWDVSFHGHKSVDVDPCSGPVPLEVDLMDTPGMMPCCYPLRHWTDADVFAYIEENDVPYDEKRYKKIDGKWVILPYQRENPDYMPACLKCVDPDEGEFVFCPKWQREINNVSASVRWEKPKAAYCNLRVKEEA